MLQQVKMVAVGAAVLVTEVGVLWRLGLEQQDKALLAGLAITQKNIVVAVVAVLVQLEILLLLFLKVAMAAQEQHLLFQVHKHFMVVAAALVHGSIVDQM
jgi:hypothetical protein